MTLDEAIEHAKEVARTCDDSQCAADHIQLAEWLRRARGADEAARWYMSKIQNLQAESTKLVDMLGELYWCSHQLGCDRCTSRECCGTLNRMRELGIEVEL